MGFDGALTGDDVGGFPLVDLNVAQPGFFRAMEVPVLSGREFTGGDSEMGDPVVVIGRGLVTRLWAGADPIGDTLWVVGRWRRVVGVVPHTLLHGLAVSERPQAWVPHAQVLAGRMTLVMATVLPADSIRELAATVVGKVDPDVPVGQVLSVESMIRARTAEERFVSAIVTAFSVVSLLLAGFAVYGLMSAVVTSRRREIGIRIAMGGSGPRLGRTVALEAAGVALIGVAFGSALYALVDTTLDPLAFVGAPPPDLGLYMTAASVCLLIGSVAGLGPAIRAAKTDPARLLTGQ